MPKGVFERKKKEVTEASNVVENVPHGTIEPKKKVRRFSDSKDHKGEGEPLCHNCGHREDMHHVWDYYKDNVQMKDIFTGQHRMEQVDRKEKNYSREKPCQHACTCKAYE